MDRLVEDVHGEGGDDGRGEVWGEDLHEEPVAVELGFDLVEFGAEVDELVEGLVEGSAIRDRCNINESLEFRADEHAGALGHRHH